MKKGFKIDGLQELENTLDELQEKAEDLEQKDSVRLDELISDDFLRTNTKFQSFDEFAGHEIFKQYDAFEDIPQNDLDAVIEGNSSFSTFNELLEHATQDYIRRQLGF